MERKKMYVLKHSVSKSILLTNNEKVAKYFTPSGRKYHLRGTVFIDNDERDDNKKIIMYQTSDLTKYEYRTSEMDTLEERKRDLKLLTSPGFIQVNRSQDPDFIPLYQVKQKMTQFIIDPPEDVKNCEIVGYVAKTNVPEKVVIPPKSKTQEISKPSQTDEKSPDQKNKKKLETDGSENSKFDVSNEKILTILSKSISSYTNVENLYTDYIEICNLSIHEQKMICEKNGLTKILEVVEKFDVHKHEKVICLMVNILNNFAFDEFALTEIRKNSDVVFERILEVLNQAIGGKEKPAKKKVIRSVLIMLQTATRDEKFCETLCSWKQEMVAYPVELLEMFFDDHRLVALTLGVMSNLSEQFRKVNNFFVVKLKRILDCLVKYQKKIKIVQHCCNVLKNINVEHNNVLESKKEISLIQDLMFRFYYNEKIFYNTISLFEKVTLWNFKHIAPIDISKNGIDAEYEGKEILKRIVKLNEKIQNCESVSK